MRGKGEAMTKEKDELGRYKCEKRQLRRRPLAGTLPMPLLRLTSANIVVKNLGVLPESHLGTNYDSWIFMDEIIVK